MTDRSKRRPIFGWPTRAQVETIHRLYLTNHDKPASYRAYRKQAMIITFGDQPVIIPWSGAFLYIDSEGEAHEESL